MQPSPAGCIRKANFLVSMQFKAKQALNCIKTKKKNTFVVHMQLKEAKPLTCIKKNNAFFCHATQGRQALDVHKNNNNKSICLYASQALNLHINKEKKRAHKMQEITCINKALNTNVTRGYTGRHN